MAHAAATRRGPDEAELATLGQRQLDLQEERYHTLLAAVRNDFLIANDPSGPRNLRKVSFAEYEDAALPSVEAALEPMSTQRAYIDAAHRMFSSNAKTLEGGILYMIAEPQFWAFMRYYHSPAKTTGRPDWDRMFASLLVEPRRSIVPCMHSLRLPRPLPMPLPPLATRSRRRLPRDPPRLPPQLLTLPTERNRYCYVRNACNRLVVTREMTLALREEAKVLGAICDNALCAKKERDGEPGKELMRSLSSF
ncbi:hypothetical protein RQP46_005165 [Phenoliferia psychrophenolica]